MSDRYRTDPYDAPLDIPRPFPPLPEWIARRRLRQGEHVTWVRGPRLNPRWERYVTHPALFLVALALGVAAVWLGVLGEGFASGMLLGSVLLAGGMVFGSIVVLGVAAGYFTRLVVTNYRVVILQGYEVCRSWDIDRLPRSLLRYGRRGGEREEPAVDLDALQTMLGAASGQFTGSKAILAFGKQLDQIRTREGGRADPGQPRRGG